MPARRRQDANTTAGESLDQYDGALMYGGFQGALNWAPMMPRGASYKSVGDGFPVYTEKTIFPKLLFVRVS